MSMTKRHFNSLACELLHARPKQGTRPEIDAWARAVLAVADVCDRQNPRFDRQCFLLAAGYLDEGFCSASEAA